MKKIELTHEVLQFLIQELKYKHIDIAESIDIRRAKGATEVELENSITKCGKLATLINYLESL